MSPLGAVPVACLNKAVAAYSEQGHNAASAWPSEVELTAGSRAVVANIFLSLDGRVTGPGGEHDMGWIAAHAVTGSARDHMIEVTRTATTALLGRKNYQGFCSFWPAVAEDEDADPRDRAFARWLNTLCPELVGGGACLFGDGPAGSSWTLTDLHATESGAMCLTYDRIRPDHDPEHWVAGTWTIDPAHTSVGFAVRHLMSRVRGTFSEITGQIVTAPDPSRSNATATMAMSSVSTGNDMRDTHLRSADFFDVERYPEMTFAGTALRPADGAWVLSGDLTIRDITRPVELEIDFLGTDPAGMQGETRAGFSARGSISRRDFGITFGLAADGTKIIVGDTVAITLDVEAVLDPQPCS